MPIPMLDALANDLSVNVPSMSQLRVVLEPRNLMPKSTPWVVFPYRIDCTS